jgi:trehalose utilization protein
MAKRIKVTVWNEFWHEQHDAHIQKVYPDGMHRVIADYLEKQGMEVATATLDQAEHGLTDEVIANTDVLIWWSHIKNEEVRDEIVEKLYHRVLEGMGLIVLHSGKYSKLFKRLTGTSAKSRWRVANEKERLWVTKPSHPIVQGIGEYFELEKEEMYGEFCDIPEPDEVVLTSWFEGGDISRSGITYKCGQGKVFYFRPGHEEYPTFYNGNVMTIIANSVRWTADASPTPIAPAAAIANLDSTERNVKSLEPIKGYFVDGRGKRL